MAEAKGAGKEAGVPISELTLGEAESFLNSLMCLPEITEKTNAEQGIVFISDRSSRNANLHSSIHSFEPSLPKALNVHL